MKGKRKRLDEFGWPNGWGPRHEDGPPPSVADLGPLPVAPALNPCARCNGSGSEPDGPAVVPPVVIQVRGNLSAGVAAEIKAGWEASVKGVLDDRVAAAAFRAKAAERREIRALAEVLGATYQEPGHPDRPSRPFAGMIKEDS